MGGAAVFYLAPSIKPGHMLQIPYQIAQWRRTASDTGAFPYLSNKYDAHLAVVKLDKPHRWFVFNHLGAGSLSE